MKGERDREKEDNRRVAEIDLGERQKDSLLLSAVEKEEQTW